MRRRLRSDFSRFDPRLARRRPHFSNFGPPAAPTLATLLAAWIEDLFAEAPVGAVWRPRRTLAHRGPRRPTLAGFVPSICGLRPGGRSTLADLTPKDLTLATSTPRVNIAPFCGFCALLEMGSMWMLGRDHLRETMPETTESRHGHGTLGRGGVNESISTRVLCLHTGLHTCHVARSISRTAAETPNIHRGYFL